MIYLVLGRREVGKSTLALSIVRHFPRRVIFDPRGLFPAANRLEDQAAVHDAFTPWFDDATVGGELVITPLDELLPTFIFTVRELQTLIRAQPTNPIAFLIDEARFIKTSMPPALDWILRCSVRDVVSIIFTAHRPTDVTPDVRAISDKWLLFQATQEHDLDVIRERCSDAIADQASRLPPRHFLEWDDSTARLTAHEHPDRWFVPLGLTRAAGASGDYLHELNGRTARATPPAPKLFD